MKKRIIALFLAAVLACGHSQVFASEEVAEEEIEITFAWANGEDKVKEAWRKYVFEPFMEKHPNVTIKAEWIPNIQHALRVQLTSGEGPDMFYMDSIDIIDLANAGNIISLEEFREEYKLDEYMQDWALRACSFNDELYGLPHSVEATALTYNKTLLDQLGVPVPTTREEFVAACEAALDAGIIPISFGYSGETNLMQWVYEHYLTTYAGDKVVQLLKGEIDFSDPDIRGAFELMKADWDANYFNDKKSGAITLDEARSLFTNQKALFSTEGAWYTLVDTAPGTWEFEWGQTKWPSMKDGVEAASGIAVGESIGINSNCEHPELIVEMMMDFYTNSENAAAAINEGGFSTPAVPIPNEAYPEEMHEDIRTALEAQASNMEGTVGYAPWAFYPAKTAIYMYDNLDKLFYDQISLDDFMNSCQECIEEDFADGYVFAG